jgi:hypothetical protein
MPNAHQDVIAKKVADSLVALFESSLPADADGEPHIDMAAGVFQALKRPERGHAIEF